VGHMQQERVDTLDAAKVKDGGPIVSLVSVVVPDKFFFYTCLKKAVVK
jgi:hypothetical protein